MQKKHPIVPGYVYTKPSDPSLVQGDVIKVTGPIRLLFKKYYPGISSEPFREDNYLMVLSQSCDLVRKKDASGRPRNPKLSHITLCLVRPLSSFLAKQLENASQKRVGKQYLVPGEYYEFLLTQLTRLINNSEAKTAFFLPQYYDGEKLFPSHMAAILNLPFALRTEHYQHLLDKRVASLSSEFRAKVGMLISSLYGRVATTDLFEEPSNWDEDTLFAEATRLLDSMGVTNAVDQNFIATLVKNPAKNRKDLEERIQVYKAEQRLKDIAPELRAVENFYRDAVFKMLRIPGFLEKAAGLDEQALRIEISKHTKGATAALKMPQTSS